MVEFIIYQIIIFQSNILFSPIVEFIFGGDVNLILNIARMLLSFLLMLLYISLVSFPFVWVLYAKFFKVFDNYRKIFKFNLVYVMLIVLNLIVTGVFGYLLFSNVFHTRDLSMSLIPWIMLAVYFVISMYVIYVNFLVYLNKKVDFFSITRMIAFFVTTMIDGIGVLFFLVLVFLSTSGWFSICHQDALKLHQSGYQLHVEDLCANRADRSECPNSEEALRAFNPKIYDEINKCFKAEQNENGYYLKNRLNVNNY